MQSRSSGLAHPRRKHTEWDGQGVADVRHSNSARFSTGPDWTTERAEDRDGAAVLARPAASCLRQLAAVEALGANPAIDPMRATGSGCNPLHVDVVNATEPPDYINDHPPPSLPPGEAVSGGKRVGVIVSLHSNLVGQ